MKTKISIFFGLFLSALLLTACPPQPTIQPAVQPAVQPQTLQQQLNQTPEWFLSPVQDTEEFLYAVGNFVSSRRNIAVSRATLAANQALAVKLGTIIENLQEDFNEEINSGDRENYNAAFSNSVRQITNQKLQGVAQDQLAFASTPDGKIEAFVLVRMPVGEAKASLLNALSMEEELYVRFQRSQAYERMDQSMKQYYGENTPK